MNNAIKQGDAVAVDGFKATVLDTWYETGERGERTLMVRVAFYGWNARVKVVRALELAAR